MRASLSVLALAASLLSLQALANPQAPKAGAPSGCVETYNGVFVLGTKVVGGGGGKSKREDGQAIELRRRQGSSNYKLSNGVLSSTNGQQAYIASDNALTFGPSHSIPSSALYTSGFSICSNLSLALGPTVVWYQCGDFSGSGINNVYYGPMTSKNCRQLYIDALAIFAPTSLLPIPSSTGAGAATISSVPLAPGPVSLSGTTHTSVPPGNPTHTVKGPQGSKTSGKGKSTGTGTGKTAMTTTKHTATHKASPSATKKSSGGARWSAGTGLEALALVAGLAGVVL